MRWMGLDVGSKRIGVALSDELGITAQPLLVLTRHGGSRDLEALARLAREHAVTGVVAGLPLNMDGSEGETAARVRRFTERLAAHLGLPVRLWDERLTTWEAEGVLRQAGVRSRKQRQVIDKLAAALILKGFLEAARADAVEGKA